MTTHGDGGAGRDTRRRDDRPSPKGTRRSPAHHGARAVLLVLGLAACAGTSGSRDTTEPGSAPPVDWQPWSAETFARAARERRPILVNVVAAWCHWCHVMDAETYADPDVRRVLDRRYVAVRVDSDARPDVAERYRAYGWPATGILTPDARPLLARRGFQEPAEMEHLLRAVADDVAAGRRVAPPPEPAPEPVAAEALLDAGELAESRLDTLYDATEGGWGRQKYPLAAPVELLVVRDHLDHGDAGRAAVAATLAGWRRLLDPVWGGLYQYSVRGDWEHPHFEKIAAVQADGIEGFVLGYRATGDARLLRAARDVERYVAAFLTAADGRLMTSQDADVGAHDADTPWIDGHDYFPLSDAQRRAVGMPRIDRRSYADRNGLIAGALAHLHAATLDAATLRRAVTAAERVLALHAAPGGGLRHAPDDQSHVLHLSDQVAMGRTCLALGESTGDPVWRDRSLALARFVEEHLADERTGTLLGHTEDRDAAGELAERRSPFVWNARAARWYLTLHALTGDDAWLGRARRILRGIAAGKAVREAGRNVADFALAVRELDTPPVHVTVVGVRGDAETRRLHDAALRTWHPHRVVEVAAPAGAYAGLEGAAIVVCTAGACSPPLREGDVAAGTFERFLAAAR